MSETRILTHGALFQGIGGFSLAARNQGIPTIWECEINEYCHKLSKKNFPEIKIRYRDIRSIIDEKENIEKVSIISGGIPCQPFSFAGKQKGTEDDRYLWPETLAVIKKIWPDWLILENVPGIIGLALDNVLDDLEVAGYTQETFIIPALSVGANHRRDRVWVVAHSIRKRPHAAITAPRKSKCSGRKPVTSHESKNNPNHDSINDDCSGLRGAKISQQQTPGIREDMADTTQKRSQGEGVKESKKTSVTSRNDWWAIEPNVGRVVNGLPGRVDRLKGLGNAIVPQVAERLFSFIKKIENNGNYKCRTPRG